MNEVVDRQKLYNVIMVIVAAIAALAGVMLGVDKSNTAVMPIAPQAITTSGIGTGTFASASYSTGTVAIMTGTETGLYDTVQVQVRDNSIQSTGTITVQPLFANQPSVNCSAQTVWATPTYEVNMVGAVSPPSYNNTGLFTATARKTTITEIPVSGFCFSVRLVDSTAQYTPTVYYRFVKRSQ